MRIFTKVHRISLAWGKKKNEFMFLHKIINVQKNILYMLYFCIYIYEIFS